MSHPTPLIAHLGPEIPEMRGGLDLSAARKHAYRVGKRLAMLGQRATPEASAMPERFGREGLPPLIDGQGRHYTYLRMSVTDRCDFACVYCMPPGGEDDHALRPDLLSFEEVARLVTLLAQMGIDRVRFTGGEPLVRRDVVRLIELVRRRTGITKLVMTTNGNRLAELARPLKDAGLTGVNVSIDTLDAERFREITRGGDLRRVLAGVHAALDAGIEVKLNAVVLGGINDGDAGELVDWAFERGITPRFIELMPLGEASKLSASHFLSQRDLVARLGARVVADEHAASVHGQGPARYLHAADGSGRRVGFITALSGDFCGSCNRVRITARGDMRACLASRSAVSLRELMRNGESDRELAWAVHCALSTKLAGHEFEHDGASTGSASGSARPAAPEHTHVGMSLVGG